MTKNSDDHASAPDARTDKSRQHSPRNPEDIGIALQRVAAGDSLHTIGQDLGVSAQAVYAWLLDEVPTQYREFQRRGMITRIVEATQKLEEDQTPIEIARARELCRFVR